MGKQELTKEEAIRLITAVVDDEVTEEERRAFMEYIEKDEEVRREYESIKRIKSIISSRCSYEKAPDTLKQYLKEFCRQKSSTEETEIPIYDKPCISPAQQKCKEAMQNSDNSYRWIFSVAAGFLVIAAIWGFFNFYMPSENREIYNLEEFVYEHYEKNDGQLVSPNIATANLGSAESRMAQDFDMSMTIPELENAEFKGVAYIDFVPDFKAPMLEYYLSGEDQYIYIFAFELDKLKKFGQLSRHQEAVKQCNKPDDFYVREVNDKHVVSWKWNNVWYTAISNHSGNRLASLVKPLDSDPKE